MSASVGSSSGRPDVFAVPSETSLRFLLLVGVLVASVLVVAESLYYSARAEHMNDVIRDCQRVASQVADQALPEGDNTVLNSCRAPHERERVAWTVATLGASLVAAGVALVMRPLVRRRRRRVVPIPETLGLTPVVDHEVAALGIAKRPLAVWDPLRRGGAAEVWWQPGRNLLELSPGLVSELRRDTPRSRFILRHELAHIRNRDVALGALTDGAVAAYLVAAVLPLAIVMVVWFDGPVSTTITALARVGVVGLVLLLARASTLRSRELDADGRAAECAGAPAVDVLDASRGVSKSVGLLAHHPSPAERREVLAEPAQLLDAGLFDGFVAGFATFLLLPTVLRLTEAWLTGSSSGLDALFWVAAAFAVPIGAWLGLAGVRLAWAAEIDGRRRSGLRLGLGVALGTVAGLLLLDEPLYQPIRWLDGSSIEAFVLVALTLGALGLAIWTVALATAATSDRPQSISWRGLTPVLLVACLASAMVIGKIGETWRVARFSSELVAEPGQSTWFGAFRLVWTTATSGSFALFAAAVIVAPLILGRIRTTSRLEPHDLGTGFALAVGVVGGLVAAGVFVVYDWRIRDLATSEELQVTSVSMRYILVAEIVIITTGAFAALVAAVPVDRHAALLGPLAMVTASAIGSVGVMVQLVRRGSAFDGELIRNVPGQIVPLAVIGAIMIAGVLTVAGALVGGRRPAIWVAGLAMFALAVPILGLGGAAYAANALPARREALTEYQPWMTENWNIAIAPLLACAPADFGGEPRTLASRPELLTNARDAVEGYEPRAALLRDAQHHLIRAFAHCETFLGMFEAEPAEWLEVQTALNAELADWGAIFEVLGVGGS